MNRTVIFVITIALMVVLARLSWLSFIGNREINSVGVVPLAITDSTKTFRIRVAQGAHNAGYYFLAQENGAGEDRVPIIYSPTDLAVFLDKRVVVDAEMVWGDGKANYCIANKSNYCQNGSPQRTRDLHLKSIRKY